MDRGIVTAESLNIRSYPGTRGKVIQQLDKNVIVNISDKINNWYQIQLNNLPLYASAKYITPLKRTKNIRARVTASMLNVRSGPSSQTTVLGKLVKNDTVDVLDASEKWYEIKFDQNTAYLHADYVELLEGGDLKKGFVSSALLNVRQRPSAKSEIKGRLVSGSEVEIISESKDWYEIKFNNDYAFVSKKYISQSEAEEDGQFFYQKSAFKRIALAPQKIFSAGKSKEQKRVAKTWNAYGNLLTQVAEKLDIDVGCAIAVLCVESSGNAVDRNGRMVIRFENHQFWKYWGKHNEAEFNKYFVFNDDKKWRGHLFRVNETDEWQKFHGNPEKEWQALEFARSLANTAALKSISMGLPQIMGFNYKQIGYANVQQMFEYLEKDSRYQLLAMFDFLDNRMISALKSYDFTRFAGYYNGSGQASAYGGWISDHFEAYRNYVEL